MSIGPGMAVTPRNPVLDPAIIHHDELKGRKANFTYRENGAKVIHADHSVTAVLPKGTTHYHLNLIDENNFLVSDPETPGGNEPSRDRTQPSASAHTAEAVKEESLKTSPSKSKM